MNDSQGTPRGGGISRRAFLKGSGAATAVAVGPAAIPIEMTVNGNRMTTSIEPRVTLLDALRNYLDVTGCKRVCDRATCGACTVMLDGKVVYSCTTLAVEAQGR